MFSSLPHIDNAAVDKSVKIFLTSSVDSFNMDCHDTSLAVKDPADGVRARNTRLNEKSYWRPCVTVLFSWALEQPVGNGGSEEREAALAIVTMASFIVLMPPLIDGSVEREETKANRCARLGLIIPHVAKSRKR